MKVKLLVVVGRPAGKTWTFSDGEYLIGRGKECHVRSNSEWVSRQHCLLRVTPSSALLRDLGSSNGTLVNGVLLHEARTLRHDDQIQIGPLVFEIHLENESHAADDESALSGTCERPMGDDSALESTENLPVLPPAPAANRLE
jgi:pSer/pThr/pTyr-binding forkhead associated (FHA) protein